MLPQQQMQMLTASTNMQLECCSCINGIEGVKKEKKQAVLAQPNMWFLLVLWPPSFSRLFPPITVDLLSSSTK